jgi:hypothetical protein
MSFSKLVIADIHSSKLCFFQSIQNFLYFTSSVLRTQLERQEYQSPNGIIVSVDELCHGTWMNDRVQAIEALRGSADSPVDIKGHLLSRTLWNLDTEHSFPTLSQFRSIRDKAKTIKVHVCSAYDYHESFSGTDKLVIRDVAFETSQS